MKKKKKDLKFSIIQRFGFTITRGGMTSVPNLLLKHQKKLGITNSELRLLIHILQSRWERNPGKTHPSLRQLSKYSGMSSSTINRAKKGLEEKGYLKATKMIGNPYKTLSYDIEGLLSRLIVIHHQEMKDKFEKRKITPEQYERYLFDAGSEFEYEKSKNETMSQNESMLYSKRKDY